MDATGVIDRYFRTWNETDTDRRQELAASVWAAEARYVDPMADVEGPRSFADMVGATQEQFPGHTFKLASAVDQHHDKVRFAWDMVGSDGSVVMSGVDLAEVGADGLFTAMTGFFGRDLGAS
jgi:hypothetical protein